MQQPKKINKLLDQKKKFKKEIKELKRMDTPAKSTGKAIVFGTLVGVAFSSALFLCVYFNIKIGHGFEMSDIQDELRTCSIALSIASQVTQAPETVEEPEVDIIPFLDESPIIMPIEPTVEDSAEMNDIIRMIEFWSDQYGVDEQLSKKIAFCESGFNNVCNYKFGCTGGMGIFQIVRSTFDETRERMGLAPSDPMNVRDNIQAGIWLISQGELWRWDPSVKCWQ